MKVLPLDKLREALIILATDAEVYVPLFRDNISGYFQWADNPSDELALDLLNTYLSPKNVVIPQTEPLYKFKTGKLDVEITEVKTQEGARVIFGIKACDLKALEDLDMAFLTMGFEDEYYKARRQDLTIIARACYKPGPACFCEGMGADRLNPAADVLIHDLGSQNYAWEAKTPRGEELTAKIAALLEERDVTLPQVEPQVRKVDITGVSEKLADMFEHPVWDDLSSRCMNCGVCTYVCPSCYCFDMQVTTRGEAGNRFRCWDSCMYREYTMMAGGHNPRDYRKERYRNRFLHKLQFFNERYGANLCTGCGRCVILCPNGVNIIEVIEKIKEVKLDA
ncbi:MAG: 4Fe-4S ferredoxin [Syntrophomonadaceae bacterium]|nr:4Fe-4S ferredoxin [Syntrophomonadaceae bacterium]